MPIFLSEPPALAFQVVLLCCVFLSPAPRLARYGALSFALSLAIEAMAFDGKWAGELRFLCVLTAALLFGAWAYQTRTGASAESTAVR